jgi:hypothetical protein
MKNILLVLAMIILFILSGCLGSKKMTPEEKILKNERELENLLTQRKMSSVESEFVNLYTLYEAQVEEEAQTKFERTMAIRELINKVVKDEPPEARQEILGAWARLDEAIEKSQYQPWSERQEEILDSLLDKREDYEDSLMVSSKKLLQIFKTMSPDTQKVLVWAWTNYKDNLLQQLEEYIRELDQKDAEAIKKE